MMSPENAVMVFAEMAPWSGGSIEDFHDEGGVRTALRNEVAGVLKPKVLSQFTEFLADGESLKKLSENGRFQAYKGLIFGYDGALDDKVSNALVEAISLDSGNDFAYQNAEALAALLMSALNYRSDVNESDARLFLANRRLITELWKTLCAENLLPMGAIKMLVLREKLMGCNVPPEVLLLSEDMQNQKAYFDEHHDEIVKRV